VNFTDAIQPWENNYYLVDETNAAARAAVFAGFWQGYGQYGFKTVWLDAAEPERVLDTTVGQFRLAAGTDTEVRSVVCPRLRLH
jgi:alpha-glucosidase (family GH31 glycosyl hydrolase)